MPSFSASAGTSARSSFNERRARRRGEAVRLVVRVGRIRQSVLVHVAELDDAARCAEETRRRGEPPRCRCSDRSVGASTVRMRGIAGARPADARSDPIVGTHTIGVRAAWRATRSATDPFSTRARPWR